MQFSRTLLFAALAALTSAQNPFTFTSLTSITAGTPFNITWAPSTGTTDTITLVLRQGNPNSLATITTIASHIQNTGSYLWTPPTSLVQGTGYAFEIIDDGNTAINNYSGQFSIESTNTVSSALPSSTTSESSESSTSSASVETTTSGSSSTTGSSSSAKTTGSATSATGLSSTSTGTAAASTTSSGKNGAGVVKVGAGLLGVVGAVMVLL